MKKQEGQIESSKLKQPHVKTLNHNMLLGAASLRQQISANPLATDMDPIKQARLEDETAHKDEALKQLEKIEEHARVNGYKTPLQAQTEIFPLHKMVQDKELKQEVSAFMQLANSTEKAPIFDEKKIEESGAPPELQQVFHHANVVATMPEDHPVAGIAHAIPIVQNQEDYEKHPNRTLYWGPNASLHYKGSENPPETEAS